MVSREFPVIVTGYSHSVDVVVRRGLYLQPRGGTHSFRYQVEFCSKERGNEKTSSTITIVVPRFRNCYCRYAEERRSAPPQFASPAQAQAGQAAYEGQQRGPKAPRGQRASRSQESV